ncbi:MAG: cupin [Alphaproteobacteria bacterium]|jgi:quercetin dioxygenase-like cupin family protein|nr:cupin [Alphaproteobacteria bacterium]PPR13969.1 MAG: hypothetical protein CFH42_00835 [Alphaproteobacteria bacterium MarineAlpha12_Bin1]|tara:strand:- start:3267 stop:3647 length:381 start_codon:yes stop_codon:yes gene_type:complete
MTEAKIKNLLDLERYSPPGHTGTVNVRMVEKSFCGAFEMVHGTIEPGCGAECHSHEIENQICYVLEGLMEVTINNETPMTCGPGTIVEIPPKVEHLIINSGDKLLKLLVVYSPPLPPRNDVKIPTQ